MLRMATGRAARGYSHADVLLAMLRMATPRETCCEAAAQRLSSRQSRRVARRASSPRSGPAAAEGGLLWRLRQRHRQQHKLLGPGLCRVDVRPFLERVLRAAPR